MYDDVANFLLPGVLLRNASLRFVCKHVHLRVENAATPFTRLYRPGEVITIPVAHGEGNYYTTPEELRRLPVEPPGSTWVENMQPYSKNRKIWICPSVSVSIFAAKPKRPRCSM